MSHFTIRENIIKLVDISLVHYYNNSYNSVMDDSFDGFAVGVIE